MFDYLFSEAVTTIDKIFDAIHFSLNILEVIKITITPKKVISAADKSSFNTSDVEEENFATKSCEEL